MKASKNSWFTKFVMSMGMDWTQEYNLKNGDMNACQYRGCVIKAFASLMLAAALVSVAALAMSVAVFSMLVHPIMYYYFDTSLVSDPYGSVIAGLVMWTAVVLMYSISVFVRLKNKIFIVVSSLGNNPKKEVKNGFVRFCIDSYKAFKDKFCPMVEYTDD